MSAKLDNLLDQKDRKQLYEFVRETTTEELTKIISNRICNSDFSKVLDEILLVCSESEHLYSKRLRLVESALNALGKAKVSINHANDIVNRVVIDLPTYSKLHLIKLVEFCLASIRNNNDEFRSWKDLLPILLEILEEEKYINYMNNEVSGSKYKSIVINNVCNSEWNTEIMPSLARMFRDISLEKEDHTMMITVLCTRLQNIPLEEVPPFVYQSLRLCTNQDSKYLLEALRKYFTLRFSQANSNNTDTFETIDTINLKEVQDIESTVLYHIYQAAQLNHQHIRDYIKYFKSISYAPESILESFMLSVLLTVASIDENQIFEMLRAVINKQHENDDKRKNSAWLRQLIPDSCNMMTIMENVIDASNRDRHLVLKGLVDLAFIIMAENKSKTNTHPSLQLGTKILHKIVRKHHETVATVFQTLIDKIIGGGLYISQYCDCLAYMCRKLTVLILDHQESVITLLDQISSIPGEVATFVISAIFPLIQVSISLREHLTLTLRKTLYRKGTFSRQMAVSGILEMLKNLKMHSLSSLAMSSSQYANSSSTGTSSASILTQVTLERGTQGSTSKYNRSLCYDMLGILRKCFTHECEVRLHLYNDLYETVLKNTEIAEYILEMLLPHFKIYFETDENILIPVKLELCTIVQGEQVVLQEPLAELIFILQKIYIKAALAKSFLIDELAIILESLCKRMPRLDIEHLNLEDKLDLNSSNIKIQEKLQNVLLMIKIYEALMTYKIDTWSMDSTDSAQNIISLFKGYTRLVEVTKRAPKVKKGEGKNKKTQSDANSMTIKKVSRPNQIKLLPSIMDLSAVCKCLSLFYLKSASWATADQIAALVEYHDFYHYILRTLLQILQNVKLLTEYNLRKHKRQHMKTYCEIGKLLYDYIILDLNKALDTDEPGTILALECFKEFCNLICTYFASELSQFLEAIVPNRMSQSENLNGLLMNVIATVRTSFQMFFSEKEEHEENSKKILSLLLDVIRQLTQEINFYQINGDEVFDSMLKFTQLEDMDPQASLTIFQILFWIEERKKEYGELLNDLTLALCEKVGNIDKTEVTINNKFKIVYVEIATQLYNLINNSIKEKLDNVSWLLVRLKAEQNIACPPNTDFEAYQEKLRTRERSLCRQLSHIIQILYTLANVAIKPGPCTDFIFKNLQILYNVLSNLTKYFYGKSSKQNAAFQSVKFVQVIQFAGKPLKSAFYNLIMHTEENQNASKLKADSYMQRNKILKETKIIPRVIYEIEQFHKEILSLDKKTGVPLETYLKHSITRDFRIKNTQLTEALERMEISMLDTQNSRRSYDTSNTDINNVSSESSTGLSAAKRSRRSSES